MEIISEQLNHIEKMKRLYVIGVFFFTKFSMLSMLIFSLIFSFASVSGQTVDTSSIIEDKLVQLALQSPEVKNTVHLTKINEYQLKAAQNNWMNLLSVSVNYNEQTLSKQTTPATYVFPRYFFGVTVPLGTLLSRTAVKSANENLEIGKNNGELIRRNIKQEVLTAYKEYVAYSQLIAIQSELLNDVKTQLAQSEEKFRNATISMEAYSTAQKNYNNELAQLINLKLQQDLKKLELEKMIGVKLETVLKK